MTPDEQTAIEDIKGAIRALNAALTKASEVGLKVDITSVKAAAIGRHDREFYSAEISKLAFTQRV